jgi:serine/threonine protein kinase/Flp pilus assembly protein TadD
MSLPTGARLGSYEIIGLLGAGGMGEVYRARDARLQREVSIKVLPQALAADPERLARFEREAQTASNLNHPNILTIFEIGESGSTRFMAAELVQGETLRARLGRGPMGVAEVIDVATQIATGMAAAHEAGVVHRDLKPDNVMIRPDGLVKVLDFGLAKSVVPPPAESALATWPQTTAGTIAGTVRYMSPEQTRGLPLDARSDVFGLGIVIYEMLCGRPPFDGATATDVMLAIVDRAPPALEGRRPDTPLELRGVVMRCLEKEAAGRYASGRELKEALLALSARAPPAKPRDDRKSIAVLPFENRSADAADEFFSDGLTDEVITDLSQIRSLRVISRHSTMQLKGSGRDLKALCRELNVDCLLQGSVRRAGNAVRVTAQLIDPVRDENLWAEKYSGQMADILEIQEQISRRIVDALEMQLSPQEDRKLGERRIDNVQALELYQRARHEIYRFSAEGLDRALRLIESALEIVGDNELLYATKGTIYWQYVNAALESGDDYIDRAEECAVKVFELNPDSAAGHALRGMVRQAQGRLDEARRSYERALSIEPHHGYALAELERLFIVAGREADARALSDQAIAIDPFNPINHGARIAIELVSGHGEVVRQEAPGLLHSLPGFAYLRWLYVISLLHVGQTDAAGATLRAAPPEEAPTVAGQLCALLRLALEGKRAEALAALRPGLLARARKVEWWSFYVGETYAFVDEPEQAIEWLEVAFERGFHNHPYLAEHSTILRKLDDQPRFQGLLARAREAYGRVGP